MSVQFYAVTRDEWTRLAEQDAGWLLQHLQERAVEGSGIYVAPVTTSNMDPEQVVPGLAHLYSVLPAAEMLVGEMLVHAYGPNDRLAMIEALRRLAISTGDERGAAAMAEGGHTWRSMMSKPMGWSYLCMSNTVCPPNDEWVATDG